MQRCCVNETPRMKISPLAAPGVSLQSPPSSAMGQGPVHTALPTAPSSGAPSDAELRIAAAVTAEAMAVRINELAAQPRVHRTDQQRAAALAVAQHAKDAGWDVHIEELPTPVGPVVNVVAEKSGSAPDGMRKLVIAGAHLDSVPRAPGGNDNASGSAALLELVRALGAEDVANDVRVVWFDGEERGLFGSAAHVRNMPAADIARTIAMLNADMIGSPKGDVGFSVGASTTSGLGNLIATVAQRNGITATFRPERHARSDHHSFDKAGIPSLHFGVSVRTVGKDDPNYHSSRDTAANIDPARLEAHADLLALSVLELGQRSERVAGPPPPRGVVVDDGPPI